MDLIVDSNTFIVFDLDDTLYYEEDYVKSGFEAISNLLKESIKKDVYSELYARYKVGKEVFNYILEKYDISTYQVKDLIYLYRNHFANIKLRKDAELFLKSLKALNIKIGLLTDGRSITQRNKLAALKIENQFDLIIISEEFGSEKPSIKNFEIFEKKFPNRKYYFFGDNIKKDFVSPNKLGWLTFCLIDQGKNIHSQNINVTSEYKPKYFIKSFSELNIKYE